MSAIERSLKKKASPGPLRRRSARADTGHGLYACAWVPPASTWRSVETALRYLETGFGANLHALHDLALAEVPIPSACVFDLLDTCKVLAAFLRAPSRVEVIDETQHSAVELARAAKALAARGRSWIDSSGI